MGQQHNTHIANSTKTKVKVVLTDNDRRNTTQIIQPKQYVCIPTPHGRVSVAVFRRTDMDVGVEHKSDGTIKYNPKAEAAYTDDSDRSFIVKEVDGDLTLVRSKYGNIWGEETGLR